MTTHRSVVAGVGHFLPERVVPNQEFESFLDTSDQWIRERTGIEERRFAADGETTSDLAIQACKAALADAGLGPADIDLVVLATSTPDNTFPSTATRIQAELGMEEGFAFDIQAVCAGFIYALANADALLNVGLARRALVVGAETFSRILDMSDRGTCILFGDGAGAVVLESTKSNGAASECGILSVDVRSDGRFRDILFVDGGVSKTGTVGQLRMDGREVFRHAVEKLTSTAKTALQEANLTGAEVDWIVPHQANLRIIRSTMKRLGIPEEKAVITLGKHGNTSAASIPMALSEGKSAGRIRKGDIVLLEAIGGGLAWGTVILRW